jgi:HEAT repeat protein
MQRWEAAKALSEISDPRVISERIDTLEDHTLEFAGWPQKD